MEAAAPRGGGVDCSGHDPAYDGPCRVSALATKCLCSKALGIFLWLSLLFVFAQIACEEVCVCFLLALVSRNAHAAFH